MGSVILLDVEDCPDRYVAASASYSFTARAFNSSSVSASRAVATHRKSRGVHSGFSATLFSRGHRLLRRSPRGHLSVKSP